MAWPGQASPISSRRSLALVFNSVHSPEACLNKNDAHYFCRWKRKKSTCSCAVAAEQVSSTREEEVFEIRIDGKLVCSKRRGKAGVYLHMETFEQVRAPSTRPTRSPSPSFWRPLGFSGRHWWVAERACRNTRTRRTQQQC